MFVTNLQPIIDKPLSNTSIYRIPILSIRVTATPFSPTVSPLHPHIPLRHRHPTSKILTRLKFTDSHLKSFSTDIEKLEEDYNLRVGNIVDLRGLAADGLEMVGLRNAGLKSLSKEVLGLEISKPKAITMSRWDYQWLSVAQIQYACLDAFVSFEIGRTLNASNSSPSD